MAPKRKSTGGEKPVVKRSKKNDDPTLLPKASEEADEKKKRKTASTDGKAAGAKGTGALKERHHQSQGKRMTREKTYNGPCPPKAKRTTIGTRVRLSQDIQKILYNQAWDEIRASQSPFKFPALPGPVYKGKGGKCKDVGEKASQDAHHSSTTLQRVFNRIKHTTKGKDNNNFYTRNAFDAAFHETNDAVVASESTVNPILVLDQDYRVDV
jgi:hypothetical protein